jgi:hypothetical protein
MLALVERTSSRALRLAALVGLFLLLVACFVRFLSHFSYLPGTDAYYYALQTQSLLDSGHLKVPDGGVLYYLVAALSRSGMSMATGFKVVLAAIYSIYNFGILLLLLRLKKGPQPLALVLWVVSNSVVAFHTIEFPELSLGLAMIPLWFWLLAGRLKRRMLWLSLLLAGCAFVHLALAGLALLFAALALLQNTKIPRARLKHFAGAGLALGLAGCAALVIGIVVKWASLKLRLASLRPGPPGLWGLIMTTDIPTDMKLTVLFFWLLLLALFLISLSSHLEKWRYLTVAALALPLWPSHDSGLPGLGGRLAALFVFLALPLMILVCDEISDHSKLLEWLQSWRARRVVALAAVAAVTLLPARLDSYRGLLMSDDYAAYEKVVAALGKADIPMLIAHRGLDFFYSYRLRRDAFHFDPEPDWKRSEIWRVAARITPEEVAYYLPPSCNWGESARTIPGTDYLLVREDCWEQLRVRIAPTENPDLYMEVWQNMENPSQPRPAFLREKYRSLIERTFPAFGVDQK